MPTIPPSDAALKAYLYHGVNLEWKVGDSEAVGDCPFCEREGKFSVNTSNGKYQCFACRTGTDKGGGGPKVFVQKLHSLSYEQTTVQDYEKLCQDRGLVYLDTPLAWHMARSVITGRWLLPAFDNADLGVATVYVKGSKTVYPTPGLGSGIFGVSVYDKSKENVFLTEGSWDGMILWETARHGKYSDEGDLIVTANLEASIMGNCNVLSVPGCGSIGKPFRKWLSLFMGKTVYLLFDNDHPRKASDGREIAPAGLEATKRATQLLSGIAKEIYYLAWGPDGWSDKYPNNYDIRDKIRDANHSS